MKQLLEQSRYLILVCVIASLAAAVAAFLWGVVKTATAIGNLIATSGKDPLAAFSLIELIDAFMIGTALYIFAIALYELFIGDLNLPPWLTVHNLDELKVTLANVIILVMAITFLEHLLQWTSPQDTFLFGLAVAAVAAVLIAFGRKREKA